MIRDLGDALLEAKSALLDKRRVKSVKRALLRDWWYNNARVVIRECFVQP